MNENKKNTNERKKKLEGIKKKNGKKTEKMVRFQRENKTYEEIWRSLELRSKRLECIKAKEQKLKNRAKEIKKHCFANKSLLLLFVFSGES